ncbi:MFS transporter [Robertmurraya massiliosenegalensis]|uniref:MFS transporter n=1 Tax=Robertmurraya TaxID=2837507 RepID=UPI0039A520A3
MQLWMFLGIQLIVSIVLQGTKPIVSLYADSLGASSVQIGILVSAYAFLPMLFAIKIGKILDRIGAKKLTLFGAIGMLVAVSAPILFPNYYALLFTQLIIGCSVICCLISMQKTIGNLSGSRDKLIALFSLMGAVGEFIGPIQMSFIYEHFGIKETFSVSIIFLIVVIVIVTALPKTSWKKLESAAPNKHSTFSLLANSNLRKAMITSGLVLSSKDLFVAYFPVYATDIGFRPSTIGIIISVSAAAAMFVRIFQFPLVHRFGRGRVLTATLLISAICFILIPLFSQIYILLLVSAMLGMGLGLGQPLSLVFALNVSKTERHGEVLGLRLTINRISQFTAPFAFGGIGMLAGVGAIFYLIGSVIFTGMFFTKMSGEEAEKVNEKNIS